MPESSRCAITGRNSAFRAAAHTAHTTHTQNIRWKKRNKFFYRNNITDPSLISKQFHQRRPQNSKIDTLRRFASQQCVCVCVVGGDEWLPCTSTCAKHPKAARDERRIAHKISRRRTDEPNAVAAAVRNRTRRVRFAHSTHVLYMSAMAYPIKCRNSIIYIINARQYNVITAYCTVSFFSSSSLFIGYFICISHSVVLCVCVCVLAPKQRKHQSPQCATTEADNTQENGKTCTRARVARQRIVMCVVSNEIILRMMNIIMARQESIPLRVLAAAAVNSHVCPIIYYMDGLVPSKWLRAWPWRVPEHPFDSTNDESFICVTQFIICPEIGS